MAALLTRAFLLIRDPKHFWGLLAPKHREVLHNNSAMSELRASLVQIRGVWSKPQSGHVKLSRSPAEASHHCNVGMTEIRQHLDGIYSDTF